MRSFLFLIAASLLGAALKAEPLAAPLAAEPPAAPAGVGAAPQNAERPSVDDLQGLGDGSPEIDMNAASAIPADDRSGAYADSALLKGARFTLRHEMAVRPKAPHDVANNRSSFRMEYEKHFFDTFRVHFDVAETEYWGHDHRAEARDVPAFSEYTVKDAFMQFSKGSTSVKLGRQVLIWGESDAGAITDVISPRNLSELFFISLEEARISQFMLTVDQFSPVGDWSLFYVPKARFNQYPEIGTAYFGDPFNGGVETRTDDARLKEYGLRWKRTFGNTDLSLMAASLIDNDYAVSGQGLASDGRLIVRNGTQRFRMIGGTFSHVADNLLFTGEVARKSPKAYLDGGTLQSREKDAVDTSLRVEYSIGNGGNHAVSLEAVNRHVLGWEPGILPTAKNTNSFVLGWRNSFLNDDLSANWLTVYNQTYTSFQHSLFLAYRWNAHINLTFDTFYLSVKDRRNDLSLYRGQSNAVFRANYVF